MEDKAGNSIDDSDQGDNWQHYTRHPAVEGSPHARYKQGYAGEHRGIHDTLAIAANVMLIRHLKPTQQAGKSGDK
jgi:hypothetical protein